jgi:hypothetical protein
VKSLREQGWVEISRPRLYVREKSYHDVTRGFRAAPCPNLQVVIGRPQEQSRSSSKTAQTITSKESKSLASSGCTNLADAMCSTRVVKGTGSLQTPFQVTRMLVFLPAGSSWMEGDRPLGQGRRDYFLSRVEGPCELNLKRDNASPMF